MKYFIFVSVFFCLIAVTGCKTGAFDDGDKRPNILFIMSDDHGYQAVSAYDDRLIKTPNIDRLADEGIKFTNACVANSICAPSRATILTGKHSHLNGKIDNHVPFDTTNVTFPQLFQQSGYQTALFGKLHFGNNPKGFDEFKILPGQGDYYNPEFITKEKGTISIEGYVTDIITDLTLDWMKNEREKDKPFLLMYLHKAPHREWLPAPRHLQEFMQKEFPEPATLYDDYAGRGNAAKSAEMNILKHMNWAGDSKIKPEIMDELGIEDVSGWDKKAYEVTVGRLNEKQKAQWDAVYGPMNERFKRNFSDMSEKQKMQWRYQRYMQDYLGTIASVDENVGRVLDYLDENGLSDNTMVVYTSDQGFFLGEHGWFDKRFAYNESFKIPLLIRWPKVIEQGIVSNEMVQNLDFAQTFLEAAQIQVPNDLQGKSMMPLLMNEKGNWNRDAVYYHYYEYPSFHMVKRHYAIITKDYKLMHFYYDVDEWELYDRVNDPSEMQNVYDDPAYSSIRKDLQNRLSDLRFKYGDSKELDQEYLNAYLNQIEQSNMNVNVGYADEEKK